MARKHKDLTGCVFGDLKVIRFFGPTRPNNKKDKKLSWVCQCKCGKEVQVRASSLNCSNPTSSCFECARKNNGLKYSNLIGRRFGRLMVLAKAEKPSHTKSGSQFWSVTCDCGEHKTVSTNALKTGGTVSCGCYNREMQKATHTKHGLSNDWSAYHKMRRKDPCCRLKHLIGCCVRKSLKNRNSPKLGSVWECLSYSPEDLKVHLENQWEPWMNWSNYGGSSNSTEKTWWIDHIVPQSDFEYVDMTSDQFKECWKLSNLRPLEKIKNMQKGNRK